MLVAKKLYSKLLAHHLHLSALATNPACSDSTALNESSLIANSPKNMDDDKFKYESGASSIAFVTAPDNEIAKKLAKGLVEEKLAACVNIIPNIQSVYMWEGKLNEDNEYLMIIKTGTSRVMELTKWVRDNHPYSVAEVITLPIENGNLPYMKWLSESVSPKK
ncbi:protein CutA homolog [Lucilia cuprina]|uniref:protein CutA homolog n=1 Tax=Lucilia cuprina TaxID=7375 RepID=UPI001F064464|nr:protein CutA homolog [Lucilia cuprina]